MVVLALVLATGCSGGPENPDVRGFASDDEFSIIIAEASEGGAGPDQLADLEHAKQIREVEINVARQAAHRAVECMTDSGLSAVYQENENYTGLAIPGYRVGIGMSGDASAEELVESCDTREAYWINLLYQTQPSSQQAKIDYADEREEVLRECLNNLGITTDPEATGSDLIELILEPQESRASYACLHEAGIDSW